MTVGVGHLVARSHLLVWSHRPDGARWASEHRFEGCHPLFLRYMDTTEVTIASNPISRPVLDQGHALLHTNA